MKSLISFIKIDFNLGSLCHDVGTHLFCKMHNRITEIIAVNELHSHRREIVFLVY